MTDGFLKPGECYTLKPGESIVRVVSREAVIKRINRKLEPVGQQLKFNKNVWSYSGLGWYYVIDIRLNTIERTHIDLAEIAKELNVLKASETIEE